MIVYLLKFIACSGILLLFYYFVLQHDRLFKFNRVFLLSIVILALLIPITTVRTNYIEIPVAPPITYDVPSVSDQSFQAMPTEEFMPEVVQTPTMTTEQILIASYLLIALFLLIRFGRNLHAINRLKKGGDIVKHSSISIVLRSDISTSFSFLNCMFTNKERYEQGNLPEEIIQHEKLHIKQHHSNDIICIELLQCLFWFNPFIYFIRKAIKLNHEFLADAFVLSGNTTAYNYQKILLDFTGKQLFSSPLFASNLNYGFTKKRLNMMVKKTNAWSVRLKQVAALAIITVTFWMLGITETVAQEVERKPIRFTIGLELPIIDKSKPSTPNGANRIYHSAHLPFLDNPLMRYELDGRLVEVNMDDFTYEERVKVIEEKIKLEYFNKKNNTWNRIGISFKPEQDKKEEPINKPEIQQYKSDTTKRPIIIRIGAQETSKVRFLMEDGQKVEKLLKELTLEEYKRFKDPESRSEFFLPPVPKASISQATFSEFLDAQVYGLWIDGKKVNNDELKKYRSTDIHHYKKDKLYRGAKKDKGYTHELNITTNEHFNNSPNVNGKWILSTPDDLSNHKRQNDKVKQDNPQVSEIKLTDSDVYDSDELDEKLAHLAPRMTVRFKNNQGIYVEKSFSQLTSEEKRMLISEEGDGKYLAGIWGKKKEISPEQLNKNYDPLKYRLKVDENFTELSALKSIDPETVFMFSIQPSTGFTLIKTLTVWTEKYFEENFEVTPSGQIWTKLALDIKEKTNKEAPKVEEVRDGKQKNNKATQDNKDLHKDGEVTQALLDKVKDNKRYWLSIDGQFVDNDILKNYKPEDFYDYFQSGISEDSKQAKDYDHEIDLVTMKAYEKEKELSKKNMKALSSNKFQIKDKPENMKVWFMRNNAGFKQVRFIDHGGELVEGRFGEFPRKQKQRFYWHESYGQYFVPYSELTPPTMSELKELSSDSYILKVDGKVVSLDTLKRFSISDFHHAFKYQLIDKTDSDKRIKEINLISNGNSKSLKASDGLWVSL